MRERVDANDARHVGKHRTEREEMCERSPNRVEPRAKPRAIGWRIRV
jgi:hypothetical protein